MKTTRFSLQRYFLLFKTQFREDWKRQLIVTLAFVILMTLAFIFQNFFFSIFGELDANTEDELNILRLGVRAIGGTYIPLSIFMFMLIYQAAHAMPFISTKTKSLSYKLLPATIAEKFCVALTFIFVVTSIEWCIVFLFSDILQYCMNGDMMVISSFMRLDLISSMSTLFDESSASGFYEEFSSEDIQTFSLCLGFVFEFIYMLIINCLTYVSIYFLGANFFRKHPFLLTTLFLWGVSIVMGIIKFTVLNNILGLSEKIDNPLELFSDSSLISFTITNVLFTLVMYVLSYYRMKRSEL